MSTPNDNLMLNLYFIGGSKGGGGKSFLSMALADFLLSTKAGKSSSSRATPVTRMSAKHSLRMMTWKFCPYLSTTRTAGSNSSILVRAATETSLSILPLVQEKLSKSSAVLSSAVWMNFTCSWFPSGSLTGRETLSNFSKGKWTSFPGNYTSYAIPFTVSLRNSSSSTILRLRLRLKNAGLLLTFLTSLTELLMTCTLNAAGE